MSRERACSQISTDQMVAADEHQALTTKADHNGTRHGPIPADALVLQNQVSDCLRQSGRTLQAGGQGFESP
jgi:hypothetical protein